MTNLYLQNYNILTNKSDISNIDNVSVIEKNGKSILATDGEYCSNNGIASPIKFVLPMPSAKKLGDESFKRDYGVEYAYYGGSMAGGISSSDMVIALGKAGFMASLGSGGLSLSVLEDEINKIQQALPNGPYMVNLLHNPASPEMQFSIIDLYIKKNVPVVEASAFIEVSAALLYYKVSGLGINNGEITQSRRIIAKVSREEIAKRFMAPPDKRLLDELLAKGLITAQQASIAEKLPVADDVTVEADSGGHTDNRPLVSLIPAFIKLRDEMQQIYNYKKPIRIGAAGGIATPASALASFELGASYVVTGSVNQACVEAGTSDYVKKILSDVAMADVVMAPCGDMFESGTKVQVIKKGTMYPMHAQKLYNLYSQYPSIEAIPPAEIARIEKSVFKCTVDDVWQEVCKFFGENGSRQLELANKNGKIKMALIFRWYLGSSSRWAINGVPERRMDMQIWCGQSMGAFNSWVRGTYLEEYTNRTVVDIAKHIMNGAAYLKLNNVALSAGVSHEDIPQYAL